MFRIHEFQVQFMEKPVSVEFWGPKEWKDLDADYGDEQLTRLHWVKSIINSFPDAWRALPHHRYIDFLTNQGFEYDEYLIRPSAVGITILCRTVAHI